MYKYLALLEFELHNVLNTSCRKDFYCGDHETGS